MTNNKKVSQKKDNDNREIFQNIKNYTNNWIAETCNMNIKSYKDSKEYETIQKITKKNWLKSFSECSEEVKDTIKIV
jgi:hypothetical protein